MHCFQMQTRGLYLWEARKYILHSLSNENKRSLYRNKVEVLNWQEIKEMVISFLTIVPFIPLADPSCQNELLVWQHSLYPEAVPDC